MTEGSFFEESKEQSQVKTEIVRKYFWAWAKVIKKHSNKIAYIDLFAGPGRYRDGTKSTPVLILEQAIQDPEMRNMLVTIFNDVDSDNTHSLQIAINSIPNIDALKYKAQVFNEEVGDKIVMMFEQMHLVPTLFFVDPWGYKGLSLRLINSGLKDWGCDCIFFFNYNRINMGLRNPIVEEHINALFGKERAEKLRKELEPLSPIEREFAIVEAIVEALYKMGGKYPLPFTFKNAQGNRTSHHLIFVSENIRGYEIMKQIMAKESSTLTQGVPSFEYNPASRNQPLLFELSRPLDDLANMLLSEFNGQTLKMIEIYNFHHVGRPYIKSNYKEILTKLEEEKKVIVDPPSSKRRKMKGKITFSDNALVTSPKK
ncbi:MAG: three-Cys-motif partner protein TcmP [Thermodesulfobacteriota bacterium]